MRHHIQKAILYDLAFSEGLRFKELKPDELDNKLFTYHLKQTVSDNLVEKDENGLYRLTALGRKQGISVLEPEHVRVKRARSVVFLLVRRKDGNWLLYKRKTHPLINLVGFMHITPRFDQSIVVTAKNELKEKTGLVCDFSFAGSGYFHIYKDQELESFTHFSLLTCEDAMGELCQKDERAVYSWEDNPDFSSNLMLPNMPALVEAYRKKQPFFLDEQILL